MAFAEWVEMEKPGRSDYQLRSLWASYKCYQGELIQSKRLFVALKILDDELNRILLILIVKVIERQVVFYADYPDIFFMPVAILKKKILEVLFSKIIKVMNISEALFFEVSKFKKKITVGIIISWRIKSIIVSFKK